MDLNYEYAMDNKYYHTGAPAVFMNDARSFTDYGDIETNNNALKKANGISNEHDYRLFLQNNAQSIMNNEQGFYERFYTAKRLK